MADNKRIKLEKGKELEIIGESMPKSVNQRLPEKQIPAISFDAWWVRTQKNHSLNADMKEVIQKHLKARGFMDSKRFDDGLLDFGIKS